MTKLEEKLSTDEQSIIALLRLYLNSIRTADRGFLVCVFDEKATIASQGADGKLQISGREEFIELVADLRRAHSNLEEIQSAPQLVVAGNVASLRVDYRLLLGMEEMTGTNLFTFAKTSEGWKATHKLYSR